MKYYFLLFITLFFLFSCKTEEDDVQDDSPIIEEVVDSLIVEVTDSIDTMIVSDYDLEDVDVKNVKEFKENLVKIEKEYGVQWDFCTCVVKGDSINKAFMEEGIPDDEFERLSNRLDVIDEKCKAFRVQNPNTTPEERAKHEKKVRNCLKEAGIK